MKHGGIVVLALGISLGGAAWPHEAHTQKG